MVTNPAMETMKKNQLSNFVPTERLHIRSMVVVAVEINTHRLPLIAHMEYEYRLEYTNHNQPTGQAIRNQTSRSEVQFLHSKER